jgi:hypothetical protein
MWKSIFTEARELVWLASMIGGLSAAGIGVAALLAAAAT